MNDRIITEKAREVVRLLTESGKTLSVAESCTGGLLSKYITDISGASAVYKGGVCTYCNESKIRLLNVSAQTLEHLGAVSRDTAAQMSEGVIKLFGSDAGIGITGIAGPSSDDTLKPVGLIYVSVTVDSKTDVIELNSKFTEDIRNSNRNEAVNTALSLLIQQLPSRKDT